MGLDPRDMTPRQIAEAFGVTGGDLTVTVEWNGAGMIGQAVWWTDPAHFARLVEERKQQQLANLSPMLAEDIREARARMADGKLYQSLKYDGQPQSDTGLLLRIGHLVARGVPLPEQAKTPAPQEDPPLTVAEVAEWCEKNGEYLRINTHGQLFTGPASDPEMRELPELTALVRGGAK